MTETTESGLSGRERADLERRYGPGFAQKIIDSMPADGAPSYIDVKDVIDIVVRYRGYIRILARQCRHIRDCKGMMELKALYLGAETDHLEEHLWQSYKVYRGLQADSLALQRRYMDSLKTAANAPVAGG